MWIFTVVLSFASGVLACSQLPAWLATWRAYRRHKTFKLTVLRQYKPEAEQQSESRSSSR